jgi:hypothetical protein
VLLVLRLTVPYHWEFPVPVAAPVSRLFQLFRMAPVWASIM